jgi:hypothetical protein
VTNRIMTALCAVFIAGAPLHAQSEVQQARERLRSQSQIQSWPPPPAEYPGATRAPLTASSAVRLRNLTDKPIASREDCLRTVAVFVEGRWPEDDVAEVGQRLRQRGIVRSDELEGTRAAATRGFACLLFSRAMGEKGGVLRLVMPNSQRYAYRDLEYLGMITPGGDGVRLSGGELASMVQLAKARMVATGRTIPGGKS